MIPALRRAQREKWDYTSSAEGEEGKALGQKQRTVGLEVNSAYLQSFQIQTQNTAVKPFLEEVLSHTMGRVSAALVLRLPRASWICRRSWQRDGM